MEMWLFVKHWFHSWKTLFLSCAILDAISVLLRPSPDIKVPYYLSPLLKFIPVDKDVHLWALIVNNLRYTYDTVFIAENKEDLQ